METVQDYRETGEKIWNALRLNTVPVAVKYIKDESEIPEGYIRPAQIGEAWTMCQAFTYARRNMDKSAITAKDNPCVPSSFAQGWFKMPAEDLIESQILNKWRKDYDSEIKCQMAVAADYFSKENIQKSREYMGFLVVPLNDTNFIPDVILLYGTPGQTNPMIQALAYEGEHVITTIFNGFGGSCITGVLKTFLTGKPQVVLPGTGDMWISGTHDTEMAIGIPGELLFYIKKNLFKTGGEYNHGYPTKVNRIPIDHTLLPGWQFLKEKYLAD